MHITEQIKELNNKFKEASPNEIIKWAINASKNPIVTTNFRPYEVAILEAVSKMKNDIPVVWCDTGYNTPQTYKHAEDLIERLKLNVKLYVPKQSVAHRNVIMGVPGVDDANHNLFTEQVKLEPFKRAFEEIKPDLWFTNLRKGQTALRDTLDVLSLGKDGVLKVSPFYHWSDVELDTYLSERDLPNEHKYFDPTKVIANRECGLHT